jgi:hypothetical protein
MRYKLESITLYIQQEKILNKYPQLSGFNIQFVKKEINRGCNLIEVRYEAYIEIADLEELNTLMGILGHELIITITGDDLEPTILIYDGYID